MPHTRSLLRVARRLTSEPSAAEDLVQETMLLAWRSFHQFQARTNARAWLFRILINLFYAQGRKRRPPAVSLTSQVANQPNMLLAVDVARALEMLSVEHRLVVMLGIVEGFTCQEIAEMLAVPIGTVMSRLNRARERLRVLLEPESVPTNYATKGAS